MYGIERKQEIRNLLQEYGKVAVADLSKHLSHSKETIRRDLQELEDDGFLKRTHGGAVLAPDKSLDKEYPVSVRGMQRIAEKRLLCKRASDYLQEGDIIFVDNSSTTMFLPEYIPEDMQITVITNSLNILLVSTQRPCPKHTYICMGGIFKSSNLSVYGSLSIKSADTFYPNKTFISCAGINMDRAMLADGSLDEVDTKSLMVERSQKVFLLADASKFKRIGQIYLAAFASIDYFITNGEVRPEHMEVLQGAGITVVEA